MSLAETKILGGPETVAPSHSDEVLPVGTPLMGGEFVISSHLSEGGFGITYLARDKTLDREIVIKECYPDAFCCREGLKVRPRNDSHAEQFKQVVGMFMHEARAVAAIRHPNIVGVHRIFEENGTAYMALERIEGQDLFDRIDTGPALTPDEVETILLKLLNAVVTVHDRDMLHRDISPDNILLEPSGNPVLIDFGAARGEASRKTRAVSSMLVVKDGYSPQEFYVAGSTQTANSDLYALAATFYHVISGQPPENSQIRMAELAAEKPDPCVPLLGRFPEYPDMFLKGIDAAMRVLPQRRLQSAKDWIHMIERERSKPVSAASPSPAAATAKPKAAAPQAPLDQTLTRLIEETNAEVRKSVGLTPKPKAKVAVPPPKPKTIVPDWVEEFNAETIAPRQDAAEPSAAPAEPEQVEPDWISRAVQKEQARRKSLIDAMEAEMAPKPKARPVTKVVDPDADPTETDEPFAVLAAPTEEAPAAKPKGTLEIQPSNRPVSKSAATGLVLVLSAIAVQLGAG